MVEAYNLADKCIKDCGGNTVVKDRISYQKLDIDNDGKEEIVCYLPIAKYTKMLIIKSDSADCLDIEKKYNETIDSLSKDDSVDMSSYSYTQFGMEESGDSQYFPITNGKQNFLVKIGTANFGWRTSDDYILGVYLLNGASLKLVDAMVIGHEMLVKDIRTLP
jgi:hypothetical protein